MAKDSNKKQKSNKSSKKTNKNSFRWLLWLIVAGLVALGLSLLVPAVVLYLELKEGE